MKKKTSRHMVRADGKTQTSISLRKDLLDAAKAAAEKENRSFSNWLETMLSEKLKEQEAASQHPKSSTISEEEED